MECVNELRSAYLCERCLHEEEADEDGTTPQFFKSQAALNKWLRKRRKAQRATAKAFKAACKGRRRKRKK
jgi:hypothetical protein